jgi:hypothetical protein
LLHYCLLAVDWQGSNLLMMDQGMMQDGAMMWGMRLIGILAVVAQVLLIAARVKHLFFQ